jgi:hypothetical protein
VAVTGRATDAGEQRTGRHRTRVADQGVEREVVVTAGPQDRPRDGAARPLLDVGPADGGVSHATTVDGPRHPGRPVTELVGWRDAPTDGPGRRLLGPQEHAAARRDRPGVVPRCCSGAQPVRPRVLPAGPDGRRAALPAVGQWP